MARPSWCTLLSALGYVVGGGLSAGQPVELADLFIKGPGGDDAAQRANACRPWAGGVPQLRLRIGRCRNDYFGDGGRVVTVPDRRRGQLLKDVPLLGIQR